MPLARLTLFDWSKRFYQYANRLAHAYLLDSLNGVPTKLVLLYFMGDRDVGGPLTRSEWQAAIDLVHEALGLRHVPAFVVDVFVDVRQDFRGESVLRAARGIENPGSRQPGGSNP